VAQKTKWKVVWEVGHFEQPEGGDPSNGTVGLPERVERIHLSADGVNGGWLTCTVE
jgi:hypothetical protein